MRSDMTRKDLAMYYAIIIVLFVFCSIVFYVQTHYQHTSAIRPEDDYKGKIPQLHSSEDRDDDGVDDQLDILNGALAYVSTRPKYKSRYYENGYPDDNYGVCTDVVAYDWRLFLVCGTTVFLLWLGDRGAAAVSGGSGLGV